MPTRVTVMAASLGVLLAGSGARAAPVEARDAASAAWFAGTDAGVAASGRVGPPLVRVEWPEASSAAPAQGAERAGGASPGMPGGAPGARVATPGLRSDVAGLVRFEIQDQLDERELEETTTLYVNAKAIGTFHLDLRNPEVTLEVTVPQAEGYEVALCGSITFRNHEGQPEMHRVDSVGQVDDVEGRVFEALGAADFTEFYLVDRTPSRAPTEPRRGNGGICVPATS